MRKIETQEDAIDYLSEHWVNYSTRRFLFESVEVYPLDGSASMNKIRVVKSDNGHDLVTVGTYTYNELLDFLISELNNSSLQYQDEIDGRNKLFTKRINSWRGFK